MSGNQTIGESSYDETNSSGAIVNSYGYDPYGSTSATEQVSNPFRYAGMLWDSSSNLYKAGERYYDPAIGRFLQTDPLSGRDYTYAGDNPINYVDPSGLSRKKGKSKKSLSRERRSLLKNIKEHQRNTRGRSESSRILKPLESGSTSLTRSARS